MPWKTTYEPNPPRGKGGKSTGTGKLTATYTEGEGVDAFTLTVAEPNFEPDDESSRQDFAAKAGAQLSLIKGTEQKMDDLLNAGTPPAA